MFEVGNWTEGIEASQVIDNRSNLAAEGNEHDEGALTVPDVVNLFLGGIVDVRKGSREIVDCHLVESKIPEFDDCRT